MANTPQFSFVLEYVDDVAAATPFFTDVLGMRVERENPTFMQFIDGAGSRFAIASDAPVSGRREREVYWAVDDAAALERALQGKVEITLPLQQLPFGTLFGIKDPAGETQYLLQFAQGRPSTAVE